MATSEAQGGCCSSSLRRDPERTPVEAPSAEPIPTAPTTHDGMVALPGGEFLMGTDSPEAIPGDGEGPVRRVHLQPFLLDAEPVTNARFAEFAAATGFRTEAERFGWSFVFWSHIPRRRREQLVADTVAAAPWWCKVPGAAWHAPEGPGSDVRRRPDHPATHISWNDAEQFCRWAGRRLPTEAEWEYAARGGLTQQTYPWGNQLRPGGEHRCNIWQGDFPNHDTADDGYAGTSPARAFPPNGFGLYSMTGNTWEWCADWFAVAPGFPELSHDPSGPATGSARVTRGGSFLCHRSYCNRYRVSARSSMTPDSSTANTGFRCAF